MKPPQSPREMPANSGRLFVFEEPAHRGEAGSWRIAALITGQPLRAWPRRFADQEHALEIAETHAAAHGMRVLLAVPRLTARLR